MKLCPNCGYNLDQWKEYYCQCGCGICCKTSDPEADEKIEAWKKKHVCKGKK